MITYAVDPGKHQSAVAAFDGTELIGVWLTSADKIDVNHPVERGAVVMELPRVYPGSKVRANDLVDLTNAGATVSARLALPGKPIATVAPAEWKGQVPKEICQRRVLGKLSLNEQLRLDLCLKGIKPSLHHNLFDACGIGLFFLKRCRRGVV